MLVDTRAELERRAVVIALEGVARQLEFCGMVGRSPGMQEIFSLIQRLAPHARVVLITGESWRALHRRLERHHIDDEPARMSARRGLS
jgi:transcriptional regulator with GAF, ATPase, and Fis domain